MIDRNKKILITGGGSGGHLSVASAIIDTLLNEYQIPIENILYVGSDLGMENEKPGNSIEQKRFKDAKFKTEFIRAGKLQRVISLESIKRFFRTFLGLIDSIRIYLKYDIDIIISSGGFVSVPVCLIGKIFGKKIYLHEQTATVGLSNKIVGIFADRIYISFNSSKKYFNKDKCIHIGNIVRKDIFNKEKNENTDKEIIELVESNKELPLIYISGGGLGSHVINEKVINDIDNLSKKYRIILQTGENQTYKDFDKAIKKKSNTFLPTKYINSDTIGYVYNNIDIFIGRSGANTVYELGVLCIPSILIPIPWATHNEQYLNAKVLEDLGISYILEEKDLKDSNIENEIEAFFKKLSMRDIDMKKIEKAFPVNAVYTLIEDILKI